ncbi:VOC family protein [Sinorhizobium numidicum]|uniref:VOC family protein n=1 Tax=Sinorhizobium numidicum TaxID=680248 RepID=A0ABY8D792_9HYPH|nr:VOC family protein [Sinorhizobium numidicum]WEX78342.1 VOC family protein [Sinorhizobium numidicum]WEX85001.1 VOC family protein [Sinorhizobium numidicum]
MKDTTQSHSMMHLPADHAVAMPAYIERSHLVVQDLPTVSAWYRRILGLAPIETSASGETLGVAGRPLLTLTTDSSAAKAPRSAPGLFHNAILVPDRQELGRWLAHAAQSGIHLQGASDHRVSEAIYLADPEGNGIEVYRDRPRAEWTYKPDGTVEMSTLPLDLQTLYDEVPKDGWSGLAAGTTIGHIHLQVSDIPQADAFFRDALGFDLMARYPGASFFASGKYHHHVAANVWNSRGASKRQGNMTGLSDYTIRLRDRERLAAMVQKLEELDIAVSKEGDIHSLIDPWGIGVKLAA